MSPPGGSGGSAKSILHKCVQNYMCVVRMQSVQSMKSIASQMETRIGLWEIKVEGIMFNESLRLGVVMQTGCPEWGSPLCGSGKREKLKARKVMKTECRTGVQNVHRRKAEIESTPAQRVSKNSGCGRQSGLFCCRKGVQNVQNRVAR